MPLFFEWRNELRRLAEASDAEILWLIGAQLLRFSEAQDRGLSVPAIGPFFRVLAEGQPGVARQRRPLGQLLRDYPGRDWLTNELEALRVPQKALFETAAPLADIEDLHWFAGRPTEMTRLRELPDRLDDLTTQLRTAQRAGKAVSAWSKSLSKFITDAVLPEAKLVSARLGATADGRRRLGGRHSPLAQVGPELDKIYGALRRCGVARPKPLTGRIVEWWFGQPGVANHFPWIHRTEVLTAGKGFRYIPCDDATRKKIDCEPDETRPDLPPIHCVRRDDSIKSFLKKPKHTSRLVDGVEGPRGSGGEQGLSTRL